MSGILKNQTTAAVGGEANPQKYGLLHLLCIKGRSAEILITAPLPFHHFHPNAVNLLNTDNRGTPNIPFKETT